MSMAGELGFEPRLTESESAVLPLNYSPVWRVGRGERPDSAPLECRFIYDKLRDFPSLVQTSVQASVQVPSKPRLSFGSAWLRGRPRRDSGAVDGAFRGR
jgi:hypothetical protein